MSFEPRLYYIPTKYENGKHYWTAVLLTEEQAKEYESKGYAVCTEKPTEENEVCPKCGAGFPWIEFNHAGFIECCYKCRWGNPVDDGSVSLPEE